MVNRTIHLSIIVILIAFFAGFSLADTINVPGDYGTIQEAINNASSGDVIDVAAGLYAPTSTINVTVDNLTIKGPQADVDPRPSFGSSRTAGSVNEAIVDGGANGLGRIFYIDAENVVLNGLEIKSGSSDMVRQSNSHSGTTVKYCIIRNGIGDEGVQLANCTNGLIEYNYVFDIGWAGDGLNFANSNHCIIQHNEVTDVRSDNAAIYVYGSEHLTIQNNLIYNIPVGEGIKLGNKSGGDAHRTGGLIKDNVIHDVGGSNNDDCIAVYTSHVVVDGNECYNNTSENGTIYLSFDITDIQIINNKVHDNNLVTSKYANAAGILLYSNVDVANVVINNNEIYNNTPYGVTNLASNAVDATNNWWGHITGPLDNSDDSPQPYYCYNPAGQGDAVTDNVMYFPWLDGPGGSPFGPVKNLNTGEVFLTIQAGIDDSDTQDGHTLQCDAGVFSEHVTINKRLTITGAGSDSDPLSNTIIRNPSSGAVITLAASGLSDSEPLMLQNLRIEPTSVYGINVPSGSLSFIKLDHVKVIGATTQAIESEVGLKVSTLASLSNLCIQNCAFEDCDHGWYFAKHGDWGPGGSNVTDVEVISTSFKDNDYKGLYVEKLSDARFASCIVEGNGLTSNWNDAWNAGFDINLKGEEQYKNIVFTNCTFKDNGNGYKEGAALMIKARDDGGTYGAHPATLTNVTINGGTFTQNERGIRIGEPGKDNDGPVNVQIHGASIHGNVKSYSGSDGSAYGGVINMSKTLVDATNNWWGHITGPLDGSDDSPQTYFCYNPTGQGDAVTDNVMYCSWLDAEDGNPVGPCVEPVADFTADPLQGFAPLEVQFTDLSYFGITEWLWDFGDGETSTEQNPTHIYDPPVDPQFTVTLTVTNMGGTATVTKEKYITVWLPVTADFDAEPTVGYGPLNVQFQNKSTGTHDTYLWDFGDGYTSEEKNPMHCYEEPGVYSVSLHAKGPKDDDVKTIEQLVEVYDYSENAGLADLVLVDGSDCWNEYEDWSNAIDHDTYWWTGTTNAGKDAAWAVFGFADELEHEINKVRMMMDTGVPEKSTDWVKEFTVMVSTTGTEDGDFAAVGTFENIDGGWNEFTFDPVAANYVKLVIDKPAAGWRQIGEFEVYDNIILPDVSGSTLAATSPHYANGLDEALVTIDVADSTGAPVAGLPGNAFRIRISGCCSDISTVTETDVAGSYTAAITSTEAGDKTIVAYVYGQKVEFSSLTDQTPVVISFIEPELAVASLQLVTGTECWHNEGWDKAVDGDPETFTSAGPKWKDSYAIYEFTDQSVKTIQKYRLLTDANNGWSGHWVTEYEIWVSADGMADEDFTLLHKRDRMTGDWEEFSLQPVDVKYIKLRALQPKHSWRQIAEFEVYTIPVMFALPEIADAESELSAAIPSSFELHQNFPNPFNPETTIKYQLPEAGDVKLEVYNIQGQLIHTLVNGNQSAGEHHAIWNGTDASGSTVVSGVYFYRITATGEMNNHYTFTRRMILLK